MKKLFLCSKEKEEVYIENNCKDVTDIMFATTDYQYYMKKTISGEKVIFLELDENTPYEEIWKIIDEVNHVLNACQLNNSLLYRCSYHYEHYIPRTLSTIILNLRLIDKTVKAYSIEHFFIIDNKENWKINEAIFLYALSKNIRCTIIDEVTGREKDCLFTLKESKYDKNAPHNRWHWELEMQEEKKIDLWMQQKRKSLLKNEHEQYLVGVLYCGKDCIKQVNWMKQLLNILNKDTVVISFYDSQDNRAFEECGYTVHCLEDYFDKVLFMRRYNGFKADRDTMLNAIEDNLFVEYQGINLSFYIKKKLANYFYREVSDYIYMYHCTYQYFVVNGFKRIGAWGTSNFWQTRACYINSRKYNTQFFYISRMNAVAWRNYEPWENIISIRIYPVGYPTEQGISNHFQGDVHYFFDVLGGRDYYEKKLLSQSSNISHVSKIAFLPSYPLEGRKTFGNYENNCKVIIGELSRYECDIYFKNHPGMDQYLDDTIKERYKCVHNLHIIDKFESGDSVIQNSDLVITDGSLVIFDAASYQKPVFVMAAGLDYELIKQHQEGFIICRTPEELCSKILKIIQDKRNYVVHIKEIVGKQNNYLERLYGKYDLNARQTICQMINMEYRN